MSAAKDYYLQTLPTQGPIIEVFAPVFEIEDLQSELSDLVGALKREGVATKQPLDPDKYAGRPEVEQVMREHFPQGVFSPSETWLDDCDVPTALAQELRECALSLWSELAEAQLALVTELDESAGRVLEACTGLRAGHELGFLDESRKGSYRGALVHVYAARDGGRPPVLGPFVDPQVSPARLFLGCKGHSVSVSTLAELAQHLDEASQESFGQGMLTEAAKSPGEMSAQELYCELQAFSRNSLGFKWVTQGLRDDALCLVQQWEQLCANAAHVVSLSPLLRNKGVALDLRYNDDSPKGIYLEWVSNESTDAVFRSNRYHPQGSGGLARLPRMMPDACAQASATELGKRNAQVRMRLLDLLAYFSVAVAHRLVEYLGSICTVNSVRGFPTVRRHGQSRGSHIFRVAYPKGAYGPGNIKNTEWIAALDRLELATGLSWVSLEEAVSLPAWQGSVQATMLRWRVDVAAAGGILLDEKELPVLAKDLCWSTRFKQECPLAWDEFNSALQVSSTQGSMQ